MGRRGIDLTGQRFGRLLVIERVDRSKLNYVLPGRQLYWLCKCDCGEELVVASSSLLSGKTKSCGCLRIEFAGSLVKRRWNK